MKLKNLLAALACAAALGCGDGEPGAAPGASDPEANLERVLKPLPDEGFKAQITVANPPERLARGERVDVSVRVKNASGAEWPMRGQAGSGNFQVNLGGHWLDADGKDVKSDQRSFLPKAVKPGEEFEATYALVAPDRAGAYTVEIDMVQEGVSWFAGKGSEPARLKIRVE